MALGGDPANMPKAKENFEKHGFEPDFASLVGALAATAAAGLGLSRSGVLNSTNEAGVPVLAGMPNMPNNFNFENFGAMPSMPNMPSMHGGQPASEDGTGEQAWWFKTKPEGTVASSTGAVASSEDDKSVNHSSALPDFGSDAAASATSSSASASVSPEAEKSIKELVIGNMYESKDIEGFWWQVRVRSKRPDGSYDAYVLDDGEEIEWDCVWPGNCRHVSAAAEHEAQMKPAIIENVHEAAASHLVEACHQNSETAFQQKAGAPASQFSGRYEQSAMVAEPPPPSFQLPRMADAVGIYTANDLIRVGPAADDLQTAIGALEAGDQVFVSEVVTLHDMKRVRGRVDRPAGWITLANTETGRELCSKKVSAQFLQSLES